MAVVRVQIFAMTEAELNIIGTKKAQEQDEKTTKDGNMDLAWVLGWALELTRFRFLNLLVFHR